MRIGLALLLLAAATAGPANAQERGDHVLAISWEPAFCETAPDLPECRTQTVDRFDATHFLLHGLWPQRVNYCKVRAHCRGSMAKARGTNSRRPG